MDYPDGWELKDSRNGVGSYDKDYDFIHASVVAGGHQNLIVVFLYPISELPLAVGTRYKILGLGVAFQDDLPDKLPMVMRAVDELLLDFDFETHASYYFNKFMELLRDVGIPDEDLRVIERIDRT